MNRRLLPALIAVLAAMAACTGESSVPTTATNDTLPGTTVTTQVATTEPTSTTTTAAPSPGPALLAALTPPLSPTPEQAEGPYFPPFTPLDTDNDLYSLEGASNDPAGTELFIEGVLVTVDAAPVPGATLQMWQTDAAGIYLHPDFDGADFDEGFQYYGETVTDDSGYWSFRTIEPAAYGGRPKHLHVKVTVGDELVLTTQIYFSGDPSLENDRIYRSTGGEGVIAASVVDGARITATHVLVLDG